MWAFSYELGPPVPHVGLGDVSEAVKVLRSVLELTSLIRKRTPPRTIIGP